LGDVGSAATGEASNEEAAIGAGEASNEEAAIGAGEASNEEAAVGEAGEAGETAGCRYTEVVSAGVKVEAGKPDETGGSKVARRYRSGIRSGPSREAAGKTALTGPRGGENWEKDGGQGLGNCEDTLLAQRWKLLQGSKAERRRNWGKRRWANARGAK
jgi:hypothetical protein